MYIKELKIGSLQLAHNLILAPLCGCSSLPLRVLAKENGAALSYPDMVKSEAVVRHNLKTLNLINFLEDERPIGIQICGGDPQTMHDTACIITERQPDLIDINMGCPVRKIVNSNAGSALLQDPGKAEAVIKAVVKATHLPVTVKIRSGWNESTLSYCEVAKAAENAGAAAITLHPRTREQFFKAHSNWEHIRQIKSLVSIPVIGNGDVKTAEDARQMFEETGCDGIMIGRGAMGNPWIFQQIKHYLTNGEHLLKPDWSKVLATVVRHFQLMIQSEGVHRGVLKMRRHACWYIKGYPGAAKLRQRFMSMRIPEDFCAIMADLGVAVDVSVDDNGQAA